MSSPFVGLPISAELSNGTVVEGIVLHIDQSNGKLNLAQARFRRFDGTLSAPQDHFVVDKDSVKDLTLLSVRPASNTLSPSPPTHQPPPRQASKPMPVEPDPVCSTGNSPASGNAHSLSWDPHATLDQSSPGSAASDQLQPDQTPRPPTHNVFHSDQTSTTSTPDTEPLSTSVATITHPPRAKPPRRRRKGPRNLHTHLNTNAFNGASTGGESGFSAREDTDGLPTPEPSPAPRAPEHPPTSNAPSDFSRDFDFQAGLMAFDKAKLWAEIALTDSTDPNDRLIAYNRKQPPGSASLIPSVRPTRNLGPTEMVLTADEQAVNGMAVAGRPGLVSGEGHALCPVSLGRLNRALTAASVEYGPNLVQRIENASRTTAEYAIRILRRNHAVQDAPICVLVGAQGFKGSCAIRTATLLANKGFKVVLVLANGCGDRASNGKTNGARIQAFEFQLRLYNSTGSEIVTNVNELPSEPALIIEALSENSTSVVPGGGVNGSGSSGAADVRTLVMYTKRAQTIGIDTPSYVNYDTGEPLKGALGVPSVDYLVCLAAVPIGLSKMTSGHSNFKEICLADLSLSDVCWEQDSDDEDSGDERIKGGRRCNNKVPPSVWGDQWWTMVRL